MVKSAKSSGRSMVGEGMNPEAHKEYNQLAGSKETQKSKTSLYRCKNCDDIFALQDMCKGFKKINIEVMASFEAALLSSFRHLIRSP